MKKMLLLLALIPSVSSAVDLDIIKASLAKYHPLTVVNQAGDVKIITEEKTVRNPLYRTIVTQGICNQLYKNSSLEGVKSISVLNKLKNQGYRFNGGLAECKEMASIKSQVSEIFLMRHSSEIKPPVPKEKAK